MATEQKPRLRIIGDVHGYMEGYKRVIADVSHTVQVGDMGFAKDHEQPDGVDPSKHVFVPGNQDEHPNLPPHALGRYSVKELNGVRFFYVAGAESIDRPWRREGQDWWPEEELSSLEAQMALELYCETKPEIVISHACPESLVPIFRTLNIQLPTSRTEALLQSMLEAHAPGYWFFGHHHRSKKVKQGKTFFVCVGELDYVAFY